MSEDSRALWALWKEACLARWKYIQKPNDENWNALWRAYGQYYLACKESGADVEPVMPPDDKEDGDTVEEPNPPPEDDEDEGSEAAMKGGNMEAYWKNSMMLENASRSRADWTITNRGLNDSQQNSANQQSMATSTAGSVAATTAVMNSIAALNGLTTFNQNAQISSQFLNAAAAPAGTVAAQSQMALAASKLSEIATMMASLVASTEVAASGAASAAAAVTKSSK